MTTKKYTVHEILNIKMFYIKISEWLLIFSKQTNKTNTWLSKYELKRYPAI